MLRDFVVSNVCMRSILRLTKSSDWYLILAFMTFLIGCNSEPAPPVTSNPSIPVPLKVEKITPRGNEKYLALDSDLIFNQNELYTFELNLPESNLASINANPAAEQYVEGSITFNGETLSPVGIRYKGSVGAFVNCLSGTDWSNPSGYKTCTKLSIKVKINWDDTDDQFYGLKKLQFHSQNLDPTLMRERLGYWLFREMGVPAPRSVHARLIINGNYSGVYALTEQIDGRFGRQNFEDGTGNLYKEVWPLNMNGQPQSDQTYLNHLKTNEEGNPSAILIRTFAEEIAGSSSEEIQSVISKWMNVEQIISFAVVDRTIRADDGPFHWYCGGGFCSNHNYYWYEDPTERKLHLIPWDLDNALENLLENVNPVTPIADEWGQITSDCEPFSYGLFLGLQRSAACDKLTAGWVSFDDEYKQTLDQFKQGPFSESQVNSLLDFWQNQIRSSVLEASQHHTDALNESDWDDAVEYLKTGLTVARKK